MSPANTETLDCVLIEIYFAIADVTHYRAHSGGSMPRESVDKLLDNLTRARVLLEEVQNTSKLYAVVQRASQVSGGHSAREFGAGA